jgi:hypothetical protein
MLTANRTKALGAIVSFCKGEWMVGIKGGVYRIREKNVVSLLKSSFIEEILCHF